jgi:hypothetical protein
MRAFRPFLLALSVSLGLLWACHNRSEEEVGAAPDRSETRDSTVAQQDTAQAPEIGDRIPMDSARVGDTTGYRP